MLALRKLFPVHAIFFLLSLCVLPAYAQAHPDFSGLWKQDNAHSIPARSGDTTLRIEHHDPELTVETTTLRTLLPKQHALQHYTTDGKESVTTGADGDSFHTQIAWRDQALVFTIVEHEDGRIIDTTEIWSLADNGNTLKRIRQSSKSKGEQTILYTLVH
ncbi:hypothetical protein [Granulicella mallensis]|uniref:Lipocalin-like domain-containing protein n=1 Tax=Granulicella mallensis (strain ATCC BAA-1857 / DSM 23137 / MP5ACTX8) TaxID=682795 RepID=G8P0V1_GRAMM|nr:hypothetical protein [Granulicella mallensis]AEU35798.1 hypothetical protein AciX8_1455 [Granulicella mallensis MP5ACTX8]